MIAKLLSFIFLLFGSQIYVFVEIYANFKSLFKLKISVLMRVSFIIVLWKNLKEVTTLIDQLGQIKSFEPRIIVVNNSSFDFTSQNTNVTSIKLPSNKGYSAGINAGLKNALNNKDEYCVLLNTDVTISNDELCNFINTSIANGCKIAAPLLIEGNNTYAGGNNIATNLNTRKSFNKLLTGFIEVPYAPGTLFLVKTEVVKAIGFLDESYFFSGEVADFCFRASQIGIPSFINTDFTCRHHTESDENTLRQTLYIYYNFRNRFLFIAKHYKGDKFKKAFWNKVLLRQWLGALARFNFKKARALNLAKAHGNKKIFGNQNHLFLTQ